MTSVPLRSEVFVAPLARRKPQTSIKPLVDPTQPPRAQAQEDKRRKVCDDSDWDNADIGWRYMGKADPKVERHNIANPRCEDVKKWLLSMRFPWLTCPQRWNILYSVTYFYLPVCPWQMSSLFQSWRMTFLRTMITAILSISTRYVWSKSKIVNFD